MRDNNFSGHNSASRPAWARYGVAIASVILGWLGREALSLGVGPVALPFIFFFPAVAIAAWFGGLGPGVLAVALSALAAHWFFTAPTHTFTISSTYDILALAAFVLASLMIVGAIQAMHLARSRLVDEIAERKRAETELNKAHELLATTLASIGDAVIVTDADGRVTYVNAEAERLTKWSSADAVGQALPAVFRIVNEETRAHVENPVEKVLRLNGVVGLANHTVLIAKDGTEIPIDDSAAPIRQPGGPLFGVVLVFRDFTERKHAEEALRDAQRKLSRHAADLEATVAERTAKLQETVNELQSVSYSIAHDMRAPLRSMGTFAGLLMDEIPGVSTSPDAKTYCERIVIAAARLDNLINDALNYTKAVLQELPLQTVDLSKLVRGLLDTYPNLQPDAADIRVEENLPVVLGNEALLTQCFSNLLDNAVKFVAPGERPQVRLWSEANDGVARIWVEDKGIGIPGHAQSRLFGMFQKLDNQYEGAGIGLAIVRKVVERMGGKVGVESEPDRGSRFWVELRVAPKNENA